MLVVTDATPLHYLILIDQVAVLLALYERVIVPQAVIGELQHARTPPIVRTWCTTPPTWLDIRRETSGRDAGLTHLGAGEQAAILLAQELQADLLLMDDKEGRQAAERRGLTVLGTLGVLARAADQRLVALASVLAQLQAARFYLTPAMAQELLTRDAARKTAQELPDSLRDA